MKGYKPLGLGGSGGAVRSWFGKSGRWHTKHVEMGKSTLKLW